MTLILKSDVAAPPALAANLRRSRRAAYVAGYPKEWAGLDADVPGATAAWQWEAAAAWSFAKQLNSVNGDVLTDVFAGDSDGVGYGNGDIIIPTASQVLAYSGGGFQLSTYTSANETGPRAPSALSAAMKANGDQWLVWGFFTLPAADKWPTVNGSTPAIITMASVSTADQNAFGISMVYSSANGPQIWLNRRVADTPTFDPQLAIATAEIPFGKTVLLGAYRKGNAAADVGLFMKSVSLGEKSLVSGTNTANATDYSARRIKWGIGGPSQGSPSHTASSTSNDLRYHIMKAGGAEALALTGRDPLAVLRSEWALQLRRGIYGLAA